MKPQRTIKAAGLAACHSDALFARRAEPADLLPEFGRLGERLARQLGPVLAAFGGGKAPDVRLARVDRRNEAELADQIGPLAANSLLATAAGQARLLFSIDGAALLAQLDRAFGGTGDVGATLPPVLPHSADLLAQRVEQGVAGLLADLIDPSAPFGVVERDSSYATLAPFRSDDAVAVMSLEVTEPGAKPIALLLAARAESLASILPSTQVRKRAPAGRADPLDQPFGEIAITLEAVLTEMRIPLSRVASFAPGQVLPIPIARAVPLRVGGTIVARGTIGEIDDRVALQITNAIPSRKDFQ